jgi:hypothetical protein
LGIDETLNGVFTMPGAAQTERVLELIDANLKLNRNEVLKYIEDHEELVAESLLTNGKVEIPTSAGLITILKKDLFAA